MPDGLDKYRQRYKELKQTSNEPKKGVKTESVNYDLPQDNYQADLPTVKYAEYNLPDLSWLSEETKLQIPQIETPAVTTKTTEQKTSRQDVEQFKQEKATDEQTMQKVTQPFIEAQRLRDNLFPKEEESYELPEELKTSKYKDYKAEDDQFTQGLEEMPIDEDTKEYMNREWKEYTIERNREMFGNSPLRYFDAVVKGLGKSALTGFGWMPEEYIPKNLRDNMDWEQLTEGEKWVATGSNIIADVIIGLGGSGKIVGSLLKNVAIKSPVGMRILHSIGTLLLPQQTQELIKTTQGDSNINDYLESTKQTAILGTLFGTSPFKNIALNGLYTALGVTTGQEILEQPALNPFDDAPVSSFDWEKAGSDAFFNTLFGISGIYHQGKAVGEQREWIKKNLQAIENDLPVDPEFKQMLKDVEQNPVVKETNKDIEETITKILHHGTTSDNASKLRKGSFDKEDVIDVPRFGVQEKLGEQDGGIWLSVDKDIASAYGDTEINGKPSEVISYDASKLKLATPEEYRSYIDPIVPTKENHPFEEAIAKMKEAGYDGAEINGDESSETFVWNIEKLTPLKSAKSPETLTETPVEPVQNEKATTIIPNTENPVEPLKTTEFEKVPVSDVERNIKSTSDMDIQAGEEVFMPSNSKAKVLEIKGTVATVQTEQGKTIKIGVGALKREPIDDATIQAEKELRKMLDGTEDLEMWDNVRLNKDEQVPVYHGTFADFKEFSPDVLGSNTGANSAKEGYFFATNKKVAESYASSEVLKARGLEKNAIVAEEELTKLTGDNKWQAGFKYAREKYTPEIDQQVGRLLEKIRAFDDFTETMSDEYFAPETSLARSGKIKEVYLDMKNPLVKDYEESAFRDEKYADIIKEAKIKGHDGVIFKNTYDGFDTKANNELTDIHVVFDKSQIKTVKTITGKELEYKERTFGSEIQFIAGMKKVLRDVVGNKVMDFAELVASKPVARDFAREKGIRFTGRKLEGNTDTWADQLVDMYKVFRSGKVENTVLIGIDADGQIIGTMALTANHPLYTGFKFDHISQLVESGAKYVVAGHNHPSGNPLPSEKDLKTQVALKQFLRNTYPDVKMPGSYVLNHKKYAWIADVVNDPMNSQFEIRDLKKPMADLTNRINMNINDPEYFSKLSDYVKQNLNDDSVAIVTYDSSGEIRGFYIEPVKSAETMVDATDLLKIAHLIEKQAGETGGGLYTIITRNKDVANVLQEWNTDRILPRGGMDILIPQKEGYEQIFLKSEGAIQESSVIFEDIPYSVDSFIRETELNLADDTIFERTLNRMTDDTLIGRTLRSRKKITDTKAWNNIMIDVERYTTKYPILRPLYQVIDKILVRNMQYDYNFGRKEIWNEGRHFKLKSLRNKNGMDREGQIEYLANLKDWHETNRVLQKNGYPLMDVTEFFSRYVKTEQQMKVANEMLAVKEHGLNMMKTTDVYVLTYKQTSNPLLEDYNQQRYVANDAKKKELLDKAMADMTALLQANQMADYIQAVMIEQGVRRPIDILNALWHEPDVKAIMVQELIKQKYAEYERQWFFPTTRMEGEYFIKATNKYNEPYFATYSKLSDIRKAIPELQKDGYNIINYDGSKDITGQVENFDMKRLLFKDQYLPTDISVPEIQQLAIKSGINLADPTIKKLMDSLNARGFKKHLIQKHYVEGFKWTEEDVQNAMESYLWGISVHKNRTIGRMLAEKEMVIAKSKGATDEQMSFMIDYLDQFDDHTKDKGQAIRRATSVWWLAGKVSYYMQQMLQPLNTALPYIMKSEFGGVKNIGEFAQGMTKDLLLYEWYRYHKFQGTINPEVTEKMVKALGQDGLDVMDALKLEGVLSSNNINDILGVQTRIEHQYKGTLGKSADKVLGLISTPSSIVEATPRTGTALSLLRVGKKMGLTGESLKNFVATGVARTMGKAAPKMGVPNVVNRFGSTMRIILRYPFVFRQFSAMNTALYGHLMDGKSGIWKIMNPAMLTKLGVGGITRGIRYAPFAGTIMGIAGISSTIYQFISNNFFNGSGEDDDFDPDEIVLNMEKYLNDNFGDGTGTAVVRGALTALTGVDVSKIFQESTVLPTETLEYERGLTETIGGAPVAFVSQMVEAIKNEDWKRVLPVAMTNIIRGLPSGVIQRIIEADWIPMTFKKSLAQGNIGTSGITLKGNQLATPEELNETIGGVDPIAFAQIMKMLGFTTLEIARVYENAKYIQNRNQSYLDNIATIEQENDSFDKQYELSSPDIIRRTKQKISGELNKNTNAYTYYTFGKYLDDIVEDLEQGSDPIVLAYANKLKTPEVRKNLFKRSKIRPYQRLLEDQRITPERYKTKIHQIINEIQ